MTTCVRSVTTALTNFEFEIDDYEGSQCDDRCRSHCSGALHALRPEWSMRGTGLPLPLFSNAAWWFSLRGSGRCSGDDRLG